MIITLLTDFGTKDYFVGAMKGVILSISPNAKIVDITHHIEPQNINSAGFNLFSVYRNFPAKTIFIAVVDPGVGSERRAVIAQTENYYFVAPDNGLLSLMYNFEKSLRVFEITNETFFNHPVSQAFHGRDIFAPVAAWLSTGIEPSEFGKEIKDFVKIDIKKPKIISQTEIEAEIIHIDNFGNLITNLITKPLDNFILEVNGIIVDKHHKYYAEAKISEVFTITGSAGFLEIVAFKDSAKNLLNAKQGQKITLKLI